MNLNISKLFRNHASQLRDKVSFSSDTTDNRMDHYGIGGMKTKVIYPLGLAIPTRDVNRITRTETFEPISKEQLQGN